MNAKRGIIVLGLLSAASMPTWAQQIKGVVIDQKSKETLIGAVVTVDGTNVKAITNIDGNFQIDGLNKDKKYTLYTSNPQPIGFRGNLLVKRQKFFYCTYSLGITETS